MQPTPSAFPDVGFKIDTGGCSPVLGTWVVLVFPSPPPWCEMPAKRSVQRLGGSPFVLPFRPTESKRPKTFERTAKTPEKQYLLYLFYRGWCYGMFAGGYNRVCFICFISFFIRGWNYGIFAGGLTGFALFPLFAVGTFGN
jgi:hypothetical protein